MSRYGTPAASYRLQLHAGFGFARAAAIVPYLRELGISHLYLSPIFAASPGSTHGYDVFDHGQVNPELGGLAAFYELAGLLRDNDMGLILDIVPNHVGVGWENPWWRDILRYGQASRYAGYFDIDWAGQPQMPAGKVVVPILGQPFGMALEAGELQVVLDDGEPVLRYFGQALPLAPGTFAQLAGLPPVELRNDLRDPASLGALIELLEAMQREEPERLENLLVQWRTLVKAEPAILAFLERQVAAINGHADDPASFDRLDELLARQHYRIADWRVSAEEMNYRRFFDVNSLAGIRVERDEVFEHVHRLVFDLVATGFVTGVRVDHIDGLYSPQGYLMRLRERLDLAAEGVSAKNIPIYVEKILERDERLVASWPVDGATGYEFMARVDGLLVDPAGRDRMELTRRQRTGDTRSYEATTYEAKRQIARNAFSGELNVLAAELYRIAQRRRRYRDLTLRALRDALSGTLAAFPVYRTYMGGDQAHASAIISGAANLALQREPYLSELAVRFVEEVLLLAGDLDPDERARRERFRRRFQQLSGPVTAKGVEDTSFFRFVRLLSMNEVGGDPDGFGIDPADAHRWMADRAAHWPGAMSASSTHDTKRSSDVRARLDVLSEIPREWDREVSAFARLNARHRTPGPEGEAPGPGFEYYLYQTLLGSWPEGGPGEAYRERIRDHALKAMREAKRETSWMRPGEAYEAAVLQFIDRILDPARAAAFHRRLDSLVRRTLPAAALNTMSGLALKLLAPGFPDIYQGEECVTLALTDPENRRPVDFEQLAARLRSLPELPPAMGLDGRKLWLTRRLLALRARHPRLFSEGSYSPLEPAGGLASRLFAFEREADGEHLAVAVPIRCFRLVEDEGVFRPGTWAGTTVPLRDGIRWCDGLTGEPIDADAWPGTRLDGGIAAVAVGTAR